MTWYLLISGPFRCKVHENKNYPSNTTMFQIKFSMKNQSYVLAYLSGIFNSESEEADIQLRGISILCVIQDSKAPN
jgi:hypothetical protein